jgi:hypothetical protein
MYERMVAWHPSAPDADPRATDPATTGATATRMHDPGYPFRAPQNTGADPFTRPVTFDRQAACGRY